jgi:2-phospho-L-lactate guanylyltransferase
LRRTATSLAFAVDVVTAALRAAGVRQVLVVTDDPGAAETLAAVGARVVADVPDAGLNPALTHGIELLRADPGLGVATLSADLPALQPADLAAALASVPDGGRAFVADAANTGTTLLAAAPGAVLTPGYGEGSRAVHLASGALQLPGTPGLRLDVDTPEDLLEALRLGVGAATAAVAARLA